jgi:hypothetical protein
MERVKWQFSPSTSTKMYGVHVQPCGVPEDVAPITHRLHDLQPTWPIYEAVKLKTFQKCAHGNNTALSTMITKSNPNYSGFQDLIELM